jgi:Methyltransferase domain.
MNSSDELGRKFAELGPWIYQFQIHGLTYGGGISAVGDGESSSFFNSRPNPSSILELGSLEGAHSFILAQHPGVSRVLAVEGREANLRKARLVQELLQIRNVEFIQENLENADLTASGEFNAVFCCGLLYHLQQPWKLIAQLAKVAPILFIWTQYAAENEATDLANGLRGKTHIEGGPDEP